MLIEVDVPDDVVAEWALAGRTMRTALRAFAVVRDRAAAGAALVGSGGET